MQGRFLIQTNEIIAWPCELRGQPRNEEGVAAAQLPARPPCPGTPSSPARTGRTLRMGSHLKMKDAGNTRTIGWLVL